MTTKRQVSFLEGRLFSSMMHFALPIAATGILQLLFNAADILVVSRYAGNTCLAAIGATTSLISLLISAFMGVSVGVNILIAQFLGSGHRAKAEAAAHCALALGAILGIAVFFVGELLAAPFLRWMKTPADILPLSSIYLKIYFLGVPAQLLYNFAAAILRAQGNTRTPLCFLLCSGAANVLLNLLFVLALHTDVAGVAAATCISQYLSLGLVLAYLLRGKSQLTMQARKIRLELSLVERMLNLGFPSGLQSVIFNVANVLMQSTINGFGSMAIAGNTAANNLDSFIYAVASAMFHAALTFTSQNVGANQYDRLPLVYKNCLFVMLLLVMPCCAACFLWGRELLKLYIPRGDPARDAVIAYGMIRLKLLGATYFLSGFMEVSCGMIRGLGRAWLPLIVSVLGACGLRILWIYAVFPLAPSLETLYLCFPLSWLVTGAVHCLCYAHERKKLKKRAEGNAISE